MRLRLACHSCDTEVRAGRAEAEAVCACGRRHPLRWTEVARAGTLDLCPVCGRTDFYRLRQFPRGLGLAIVATAAVVDLIWTMWRGIPLMLLAAVVLDAVLYRYAPEAIVCYRCKTFFEGFGPNPRIGPFDSATELRYEIEAERERRPEVERQDIL